VELNVTIRYWLMGALCVLVMVAAVWSVFLYQEISGQSCFNCGGYGGFVDEFGRSTVCPSCGGTGARAVVAEMGDRLLSTVLNARQEVFRSIGNNPGETLVALFCSAMLVGVALLVRVTHCRCCRGSGRRRGRSCVACSGRGRATLADQLVGRS
jgi:hypothetical protein